jgi:hypothetical protein
MECLVKGMDKLQYSQAIVEREVMLTMNHCPSSSE